MEAKKLTVLWPAAEQHPDLDLEDLSSVTLPLSFPCQSCPLANPVPGITVCLAVDSPVELEMCECGRAVWEGSVYYLLPLDTDTGVPI